MPSHESFRKEILVFKMIEDDSEELHTDVDPVDFVYVFLSRPALHCCVLYGMLLFGVY
jgi:hypothetical protein